MKCNACVLAVVFGLALFVVLAEPASANFKPYPGPEITAVSPAQNGVYNLPSIPLIVNVTAFRFDPTPAYEGIAWLNYSLDGQPEVAADITGEGPTAPQLNTEIANGVLSGMQDGPHTVYVRGNTTFAKYPAIPDTSFSLTIYFRIDTVHPTLKVLSPIQSETYTSSNVTLDFVVDEQVGWAGYSINGGPVVTSRRNTTLTNLPYRTQVIRVYANDSAGNECSSPTIAFTVKDFTPPVVSVLSEIGKYNVNTVPLEFVVNKNVPWLGYSLDGQENVTITGNTTLTGLTSGPHSLRVYAVDTFGNEGVSESFDFNITGDGAFPFLFLFPILLIVSVTVAAVGYLKKCQRKNETIKKRTVALTMLLTLVASLSVVFLPASANPYMYHENVSAPAYVKPIDIMISSPKENAFYSDGSTITLSFNVTGPDASNLLTKYLSTVDYKGDWMQNPEHAYRTKNFEEYTPNDFPFFLEFNFSINNVPEGKHSIVINSTGGGGFADMSTLTWYGFNTASLKTVNFTIDSAKPEVALIHPRNETCKSPDIPLDFVLDEPFFQITFSLDGRDNVSLTENTTLKGLFPGVHNVTIYATDMAGNDGASKTSFFAVSEPERFTISPVAGVSIGSVVVAAAGLLVYLKKRKR